MNVFTVFAWLFALLMVCPIFAHMGLSEEAMPSEPVEQGSVSMNNGELAFEGVVVEHVFDCAFDGHCYVIVETAEGEQYNVSYAPGMLGCPNPNLDSSISDLVSGDRVAVFGEIIDDGWILVCNSDAYYLNKLDE